MTGRTVPLAAQGVPGRMVDQAADRILSHGRNRASIDKGFGAIVGHLHEEIGHPIPTRRGHPEGMNPPGAACGDGARRSVGNPGGGRGRPHRLQPGIGRPPIFGARRRARVQALIPGARDVDHHGVQRELRPLADVLVARVLGQHAGGGEVDRRVDRAAVFGIVLPADPVEVPQQPLLGGRADARGVETLPITDLRPLLRREESRPVHHQAVVHRAVALPDLVLVQRAIVADLRRRGLGNLVLRQEVGVDQRHLVERIQRMARLRIGLPHRLRAGDARTHRGVQLLQRVLRVHAQDQPRRVRRGRGLWIGLVVPVGPLLRHITDQGRRAFLPGLAVEAFRRWRRRGCGCVRKKRRGEEKGEEPPCW